MYLAEDLKHRRQVAIKVLRPELAATLGPQRFVREIEIAASLTHPHILPLFDSGEAGGFLYHVMPFIDSLALLALALASAACQPPAQEAAGLSEEDVAAIHTWHNRYMQAERATDWNALAALVAEDVVLMPPNRPLEDWASWLETVRARDFKVIDLSSTVQEIEGGDGLAYLRASYSETYTLGVDPEPLEAIGKHVAILRKQPDGSWVATVWIWNSDLPLPQPE